MRQQGFKIFALGIMILVTGVVAGEFVTGRLAHAQEPPAFIQTPLFEPAVDYTSFSKIEGCTEEFVREVKYHACRDSAALYQSALASARRNETPLLVIFGFNKCPYCAVLEAGIFNPSNPIRNGHVARYFSTEALQTFLDKQQPMVIPVLRIHARSDHGLKLADDLAITKMAQDRGWNRVWSPFVVMVNPQTGAMASESEWEAKQIWCDWSVNIVETLEDVGLLVAGTPYTERKRCAKN